MGNIEGTFEIPEYRLGTTQNPKFRTGETEFRMTSSSTNGRGGIGGIVKDPLTAANVIYHAVGILETEQETIIATRRWLFRQMFHKQQVEIGHQPLVES